MEFRELNLDFLCSDEVKIKVEAEFETDDETEQYLKNFDFNELQAKENIKTKKEEITNIEKFVSQFEEDLPDLNICVKQQKKNKIVPKDLKDKDEISFVYYENGVLYFIESNPILLDEYRKGNVFTKPLDSIDKRNDQYKSTCNICGKSISRFYLKQHLLVHSRRKQFRCDICNKTYFLKSRLKQHILLHSREKKLKCEFCNKIYFFESVLKRHILIHTSAEKPFKCKICEKIFGTKSILYNHNLTHTGVKDYKCDLCKKSFARKCSLDLHKKFHAREKNYICDVCGKSFVVKSDLNRHNLIHIQGERYKCDLCEKTFARISGRKSHKLVVHDGEKKFCCHACGKTFSRISNLKVHKCKSKLKRVELVDK